MTVKGVRVTFENDTPISDVLEALDKLVGQSRSKAERRLVTYRRDPDAPYVKVTFFGGDFSDFARSKYYKVTPELVAELRAGRYVRGTPHWGYTDDNELQVSEHAESVIWENRKRKWEAEEAAKKAEAEKAGE